jgi:hypothetical protein
LCNSASYGHGTKVTSRSNPYGERLDFPVRKEKSIRGKIANPKSRARAECAITTGVIVVNFSEEF